MPEAGATSGAQGRIALRCEATPDVGLGHGMRLLSLARALPEAVLVADAETLGRLKAVSSVLPPLRECPEGLAPGEWINNHDMRDISHVVLDTLYSGNADRTAAEVSCLKRHHRHVTVIDSMPPDHFMPKCMGKPDLLVTPYVGGGALRPVLDGVRWLHGPDYAILSPDFLDLRRGKEGAGLPKRMLLTCGGSDPSGLSARVLSALQGSDCAVDVVVGPMFSQSLKDRIEALAKAMPNVDLHGASDGLVPLLAKAGVVVGRPGLTRYEAACLGLRGLYLVEGQAYGDYFRAFAAAGLAQIYFAQDPGGEAAFMEQVRAFASPSADIWAENATTRTHVDGQGATRVARAIRTVQSMEHP